MSTWGNGLTWIPDVLKLFELKETMPNGTYFGEAVGILFTDFFGVAVVVLFPVVFGEAVGCSSAGGFSEAGLKWLYTKYN